MAGAGAETSLCGSGCLQGHTAAVVPLGHRVLILLSCWKKSNRLMSFDGLETLETLDGFEGYKVSKAADTMLAYDSPAEGSNIPFQAVNRYRALLLLGT